jgi:quinol monooxygenase YgiN
MSVGVIVRFTVSREDAERSHVEVSAKTNDLARSTGCLHHHAYYCEQTGQGVIIDEWETAEAFEQFFGSDTFRDALQAAIPGMEPDEVLALEPFDPANTW